MLHGDYLKQNPKFCSLILYGGIKIIFSVFDGLKKVIEWELVILTDYHSHPDHLVQTCSTLWWKSGI